MDRAGFADIIYELAVLDEHSSFYRSVNIGETELPSLIAEDQFYSAGCDYPNEVSSEVI